jgi:multidrug efflux system membrane fusion protein
VALENTPNTILIPVRALGQNQDRFFVYCIDDKNTVQYREIQTGPEQDGLVVVREGLVAEDRLIIDGTLKVRPGATVDPKPADLSRFKSNPAAAQN